MTNEEAKQEAIRKAWEECGYWAYLSSDKGQKQAFKFDGYVFITYLPTSIDKSLFDLIYNDDVCRPKSLSGIENNNGWTRIEPDGSNLPENAGIYRVICIGYDKPFDLEFHREYYWIANFNPVYGVTHYKPIEPELLSIY